MTEKKNLPAAATSGDPTSGDAPLKRLVERASRHARSLFDPDQKVTGILPMRDGRPLGGQELDKWWDNADGDLALRQVGMGIALLIKRTELPYGQFGAWCAERGISASRASELQRVARMFGEHEKPVLRSIVKLTLESQRTIAALPPAIIDQLADDGTLDAILQMSQRDALEAIRRIKQLEKRSHDDHAALLQKDDEIERLKAKLREVKREYPPTVHRARVDAAGLSLRATDALDSLEAIAADLLQGADLSGEDEERQRQLAAGSGPLHVAIGQVAARAQTLLASLREQFGDYLPQGPQFLKAHEVRDALDYFAAMMDAPAPSAPAPKKRGPKPGSKRKPRA